MSTGSSVQPFLRALAFSLTSCCLLLHSLVTWVKMESCFARVLKGEILAINEATVLTNHQENYEIRLVGVYWLVENYVVISCNKILKMHLVNGKNPRKHCQLKRKQNTQ